MPDGYDETRPENHVFLAAHSRFIAPRRGSRFLSDTSVCPSGSASSYFLEVRRGEREVRAVQNIADILVDPEGSLERRNHWENTSHALLVGVILHVLYAGPDKTLAASSDPTRPIELTKAAMMTAPHPGRAVRSGSSPARAARAPARRRPRC